MNVLRANLYQALAEALAEPPEWFVLSGKEWPLFQAAVNLAPESESARQAVVSMMEIAEESVKQRQDRYAALFTGPGRPRIWIYESAALNGKLFSEISHEVEQWYRAAELDIVGTELPDHASLELAFLSYLAGAEQAELARFENEFLKRHALLWLPNLGRALESSGDPVYAPIGRLLAGWLEEIQPDRPHHHAQKAHKPSRWVPSIPPDQEDDCILCGFCVQVCPTQALVVRENQQVTSLQLSERLCVGCRKCLRVCEPHVLYMDLPSFSQESTQEWRTLRSSQRGTCKACGKLLISRAELTYVASRLGDPVWLEFCQDCRPGFFS